MKLSVDSGDFGILRDRHGCWIPYPASADPYTGDVEVYAEDLDGGWLLDKNGNIVRELRRYASPLSFERVDKAVVANIAANLHRNEPDNKAQPL